MNFRIADTFTDSLARLTGDEQKAVKTTAFDLQIKPANPGMSFHRVDRARDKHFWSVRVSRDIRIIVHKTESSLLLCYADHHDAAYNWAERRKLETHPKTGAAQIVEIRETVQEILVPLYVEEEEAKPEKPALFANTDEDELLSFGVPKEWIQDVKQADEDSILELADHLPEEAAEALLELATGGKPIVALALQPSADPFEHPDAQRRFRIMSDVDELERALDFPWEKWTIFLHPTQREIVERDNTGPVRVSGTAGTGKTIVALHRAVHLARRYPDARILLSTFSEVLAQALRVKLRRLISNQPHLAERIDVEAMGEVGRRLYERNIGKAKVIETSLLEKYLLEAAAAEPGNTFGMSFLVSEWDQVVDAWQIETWEGYRDVKRLGRKTRLPESKRELLWRIFDRVRTKMLAGGEITEASLFSGLATKLAEAKHPAYDFAIIDEAQDISVSQLRFLAALGGDRPQSLFFSGDLGQRIFQQPFSWKSLGVDIRGRSKTLRINYRTSHQIRMQADRLLDPEISDVDGNVEKRTDTISVFNGAIPQVEILDSVEDEIATVSNWIAARMADGVSPNEIGVFVRAEAELPRAQRALKNASVPFATIDHRMGSTSGHISLATMHLAKGLEFRAVVVMACDDEVIPLQSRIEEIGDPADLQDVYNTERYLLYVACTRARDHLLVTGVEPASEFLEDFDSKPR